MSEEYFDEGVTTSSHYETDEEREFKEKEANVIKCSSCGANMIFEPKTQTLTCSYCGRQESIEKNLEVQEIALEEGFQSMAQWSPSEASVYVCENCRAKVVLEKSETAKNCPFCGTSHVVQSDELPGIKPNALIPFSKTVEESIEFTKKWAKKKMFAPTKFKKTVSPENVKGVFTPVFTFDSITNSTYVGRIGDRRTRVVGVGKNRRTETYIVWRSISGTFNHFFDDVTITAGERFNQKQVNKISPFTRETSCVYEQKYLYGFMSYHYERDIRDCWTEAKSEIDESLKSLILSQYHYDVVDYLNVSTVHNNVTYKYVLLPVYVGSYTFKKKVFNFYVNGSTGKVIGKAPVSPVKVTFFTLFIAALVGGIGYLISTLL